MSNRIISGLRVSGVSLLVAATVSAQQPATPKAPPAPPLTAVTAPPQAPGAPQQVLSVVHRMNGLEVLRLLDRSGVTVEGFSYPTDESEVHTRIAAGYALGDGGSIMTRLPRAEIESLYQSLAANSVTPAPKASTGGVTTGSGTNLAPLTPIASGQNLYVLRSNGQSYPAKFVGLDGTTGLSLLQAEGLPSLPTMDADLAQVNLSEAVRIVAPEESAKPLKQSASRLILSFGEVRGQINNIVREVSGEVKSITLALTNLSLARARSLVGGVVLNDKGEAIGMVERSDAATARVIPLSAMRRAADRVRSRQAKPGQPWLGVRGEAMSGASTELLQSLGWKKTPAQQLRDRQKGVLLTSVPDGTPAARSGLRRGDVVVRVNDQEIVDADDLSGIMGRADIETPLAFMVNRPDQANPVAVSVKLGTCRNPVQCTLESEAKTLGRPGQPLAAYGVEKINLTGQLAVQFGTAGGWLVTSVQPGSAANKSGLRAGDVIEAVNGMSTVSFQTITLSGSECRLKIVRNRERMELVISDKPAQD